MVKSDGSAGNWTYDINDQSSYILAGRSNHVKGNSIKLELAKQGLLDLTSVDVSGYWKSN